MPPALRADSAANIGATRATSITVTPPAGVSAGDVLVAFVSSNSTGIVFTAPEGWSELAISPLANPTSVSMAAWWKIATASEANYVFAVGATTRSLCAWVGAYTGVETTVCPVHATSYVLPAAGTSIAIPAITTVAADTLVVAAACASDGNGVTCTFTQTAGFTEESDQATAVGTATENSQAVADQVFASAGSTGTITFTASASMSAILGMAVSLFAAGNVPVVPPSYRPDATNHPFRSRRP